MTGSNPDHGGSMLHSFRDAHKGRIFTMYFKVSPKGVTSRLAIEGLPSRRYPGKVWKDQDQAKADLSNDARRVINCMFSQAGPFVTG